ncbi:hypothetical protein Fot_47843 [Forsythia ovata]|uniref:Uncharacterized protein n=1 Tax=Forsythia ovata TaxID=205694 RepID=A0ABD1QSE9_9LAMI
MDHFQERATWFQGSLNKSKKKLRLLNDERDKLKTDLQNAKSDVAKFSKRCDNATEAQEVIAHSLEEANCQNKWLVDKIAELENAAYLLRSECSSLKEKNL